MTQQLHTPISEEVLKSAEDISLGELLESPSFYPWIISAIGNALRLHNGIEGTDTRQDKKLRFEMYELFNAIPNDDRRSCFNTVKLLVQASSTARNAA